MRASIFCIYFTLLVASTAASITQGLEWRESRMMRMMRNGEWAEYSRFKEQLRVQNVAQPVYDYDDTEYVAKITIGSPQQEFSVFLDTNSANLWVAGVACDDSCGRAMGKFDRNLSLSFVDLKQKYVGKQQDPLHYLISDIQCNVVQDTMTIGGRGENQLLIPKTVWCETTHMPAYYTWDYMLAGVLGLGFQGLAFDHITPPVYNAFQQGILNQPLLTIWLEHRFQEQNAPGGQVTYGDVDTTNCGPIISWLPSVSGVFFQYKVQKLQMGHVVSAQETVAMSATSSMFITGTFAFVDAIAQAVGAYIEPFGMFFMINCNATNIPSFDVTISGVVYSIDPVNLIAPTGSPGQCYFALDVLNGGSFGATWTLGYPFMRQFCHTLDLGQKRLGLANSLQKK